MANRLRKNGIHVMLTDEEKELFKKKLEMSKSKLMGHIIRKRRLEAAILVIDINVFRKLQTLI